jgi:hypothetical protein
MSAIDTGRGVSSWGRAALARLWPLAMLVAATAIIVAAILG